MSSTSSGHGHGLGVKLLPQNKFNFKRKILQLSRFTKEIIVVGTALSVLLILHLTLSHNLKSNSKSVRYNEYGYSPLRSIRASDDIKFNYKLNSVSVNKNNNEKKRAKILCYILLSVKKMEAAKVIKNTWGSKCDKLIFFGRFNNSALPVTFLNTSEGYRFLWGKTKAALIHLEENYPEFDWFFKADDDTFAVMENLRYFVKKLDPNIPVWFGYKLKHPKLLTGYMSGGAGYVYSRAALHNVTRLFSSISTSSGFSSGSSTTDSPTLTPAKCKADSIQGIEDLELGKCFKTAGVGDISTLDAMGRERFLPLPIKTLWTGQVPSHHWIWRQAWNPVQLGFKCCSSHVISMHQISPERMKTLHATLYLKKIQDKELKVDTITI